MGLTENKAGNRYVGYAPGSLIEETQLVAAVSRSNGRSIYGWALDSIYRDSDDALAFAAWAESQDPAILGLTTNSAASINAASVADIGYLVADKGYKRTFVFYHDNAQLFPEVSYMARILAVDYGQPDSTITMKFKELPGIETVPLTETNLSVLNDKRINTYTSIGNNSRTVREGVQGAATWFTDTLVNLDNFKEELQVEVYNVFLRTPKIPYTNEGQNLLISAAAKICAMYERNKTFADRTIESNQSQSGFAILPATQIIPVPVHQATTSDRAARLAPPIKIVAYEAGAMHKININVAVYS